MLGIDNIYGVTDNLFFIVAAKLLHIRILENFSQFSLYRF